MRTRRIVLEQDYPIISQWWTRRNGTPPPINMLPDTGVIVEEDGKPLSCAFLYEVSNCSMAIIEWEATNPDCHSPMKALRALHMVFDFFETYCADNGMSFVVSWVLPGRGDGRLLERRKWIKCPGEPHEMMAFVTQPKEELCPSH